MKNQSKNFRGWPTRNHCPPIPTNDENLNTEEGTNRAGQVDSKDRSNDEVDKEHIFIEYMHDLEDTGISPCPFFSASPRVCGEAVNFVIGDLEQVCRE